MAPRGPDGGPEVVLLERSGQLGGALRSEELGDRMVDVGPDGFLGRRPEAAQLAREVGLADALVPIAGRGASVWARGKLRPMPEALALGVPTRFWPTARSGILGLRGRLGLARDALLPRPGGRGPIGDRSVGPLVARKLGQRVVDALVDPLIGGIHAGSVDDMSTAAAFPALLVAAQRRGSLMRALRAEMPAPDPDGPPLFWALDGGMAALVGAVADAVRGRGGDIRNGVKADRLERRAGGGWAVVAGGTTVEADGVVLALPAPPTAGLLRPHDDEAAGLLDAIDYASVTLVTFRVGADDVPANLYGTGFLVPRRSPPRDRDHDAWAVTACTFLDRKWPHLARDGEVLLRASLGRVDDIRAEDWSDGEVVERAWEELGALLGVTGQPKEAVVTRFPRAFPQYRVHHLLRIGRGAGGHGPAGRAGPGGGGLPRGRHPGLHRQRAGRRARVVVRRRGRVAGPSLAAGVLLALSLPPWGWWPLGVIGAGLFYWRLGGLPVRARLWSGWLAGLGCYAIGLFWARAFNWYGAVVLVLIEALFFAAAAVVTPPERGRAPAFVGACVLAEAVRMTWPFGGLPLGGVFLGQADGPLVQLARLGGPLLLTAGVYAGGVVVATLAAWWWARRRRLPGPGLVGSAVVAAGLVALTVVGAVAPDGGAPVRSLRVALVQGGGRRGLSQEQVSPTAVYEAQLAATYPVTAARPAPALVLWPEDVVALNGPLAGSPEAALLSRLAAELHTTLLVGVTYPVSGTAFRNEIVAWGPHGRVVGVFEKVHRVPFGEYVPYRSFFAHFASLSGVPLDAVPGHGSGLMRTPAGPLGILVSFEVFYAGRSHSSVRAGAELLAVPTNTSSYSTSQVPAQEVAADVVQAIETGRDLVQAAPTGFTTVVTQRGVVDRRSTLGQRQVLTATVALRRGLTPYDHWGDLPVLILSAVALVGGWMRQLRRRSAGDVVPR